MKTRILIFCSLLLNAVMPIQATQIPPLLKENFEPRIIDLYQEHNLQGDFLIAVVNEHGLMYSMAVNQQSINGEMSTLSRDTPFYIASHTKALTATLLKILEEAGKVDLDKSLYDYLPKLITHHSVDTKRITVRQLLNHSAGFTSIMHTFKTAFLGNKQGESELIQALNHQTLSAPVGTFRYSNTGSIIAAMIVEKVTGHSWQEEMQKRIFTPLLMHSTSATLSDYAIDSILPSLEVSADNQIFRQGFYKKDSTMHAAGGTISTINDLAKWLQFNIAQETSIVKSKRAFVDLHQATISQQKTYFTYERIGYSLGWDVALYHGETILTRFGGYGGISFHASFMPSKKLGVIAFFNDNRGYKLPHLAANYLYNLLVNKADANQLFDEEKLLFKAGVEQQIKQALSIDMQLKTSERNDQLIGEYQSKDGWPEILITKSKNSYTFTWGELSGPMLHLGDKEQSYVAALGVINRQFSIVREGKQVVSLINGSLIFEKVLAD